MYPTVGLTHSSRTQLVSASRATERAVIHATLSFSPGRGENNGQMRGAPARSTTVSNVHGRARRTLSRKGRSTMKYCTPTTFSDLWAWTQVFLRYFRSGHAQKKPLGFPTGIL